MHKVSFMWSRDIVIVSPFRFISGTCQQLGAVASYTYIHEIVFLQKPQSLEI